MKAKTNAISLIGKKAYEYDRTDRIGVLKKIQFNNKDYSECWYLFEWEYGAYIVPIENVVTIDTQLKLF